jgi:hypothetical protein
LLKSNSHLPLLAPWRLNPASNLRGGAWWTTRRIPSGNKSFGSIPELPDTLTERVHREVRYFGVSLIATTIEDDRRAIPCAGTLVMINGVPGVLTARHVWEAIQSLGVLGVMLNDRTLRVSTNTIHVVSPGYSSALPDDKSARVPDIAFLALTHEHRSTIEARGRTFYDITRRRNSPALATSPDDGFCVATGTLEQLTDRESRKVCSFNYATGVDRLITQDGWDFLYVHLNVEENPTLPVSTFGGMSGGGVWRARYGVNPDKEFSLIDLSLIGVTFLETAEPGRQLVAHGPHSIYDRIVDQVTAERG